MVANQFHKSIKIFQCDGGGEFSSSAFIKHLEDYGIKQQVSCPGTPEQNGVAERKHRHIVETEDSRSSQSFEGSNSKDSSSAQEESGSPQLSEVSDSAPLEATDGHQHLEEPIVSSPSLARSGTSPPPHNASSVSHHPMLTRTRTGTHTGHVKTNFSRHAHTMTTNKFSLHIAGPDIHEPKSVKTALKSSHWVKAMQEELVALQKNATWTLVPLPSPSINVVGSRWVFKTKLHSDGSLDRFKARLVAKGFSQIPGVDFDETFSPVLKPTTLRLVIALATTLKWPLRQLDVKNAFLHGQLKETVYMTQPPGFEDPSYPNYVCKLNKSIYGLKQAPRAWFDTFTLHLLKMGFKCSQADSSLFVLHTNHGTALLLLYVDDIGHNWIISKVLLQGLSQQLKVPLSSKLDRYHTRARLLVLAFARLSKGYAQDSGALVPAIITFDFINHKTTGRLCNGNLATDITAENLGFNTYAPAYLSLEASGENLLIGANFASAASGYDDKAAIINDFKKPN
ncbi:hypothetical protein SLEP1_g36430 [Rubroshorea leprosula]|uniref:Integrase catalytic domain-containing protein n=1 Tax=Rubroshorea leprosula TaxID=152421 RepID=A0AAV5KRG3_9ROSI|nr:hypothetical protein SLEP1_g36430 [Rubroshorea leprosula]